MTCDRGDHRHVQDSGDRESLEGQLIVLRGELKERRQARRTAHGTEKMIEVVQEKLRDLTRAEDRATDPEALEEEAALFTREIAEVAPRGAPDASDTIERLTDRLDEIERALLELDEDASADE